MNYREIILKRIESLQSRQKTEDWLRAVSFFPKISEPGMQSHDGYQGIHFRKEGTTEVYAGESALLLDRPSGTLIARSPQVALIGRSIFMGATSIDRISIQGKYINPTVFGAPGELSDSILQPRKYFETPHPFSTFVMGSPCVCPYCQGQTQRAVSLEEMFKLPSPFIPTAADDTNTVYMETLKGWFLEI